MKCCSQNATYRHVIHCISKQYTTLIITSTNVNRFSKFFNFRTPKETVINDFHLTSTLLREIPKFKISAKLFLLPSKVIVLTFT